jgi:ferric-dicitrate binding protein FerR (iron transport regulator)
MATKNAEEAKMHSGPNPACTGGKRLHPRRRVILSGVGLAAGLFRAARASITAAGLVEEVKGQVTAELASQRRVLVPHADVFIGDDVVTGDSSRAAMLLGRDTTVRLGANTRLRIDRFVATAGGVLTLESGPLLLDKAQGDPSAALQVRGAFGLIAVRGTQIFVGPSQGVVGIFVVHGLIDVSAGGLELVLQTGEGTNIAGPGASPTPPVFWGEPRIRAALASVS